MNANQAMALCGFLVICVAALAVWAAALQVGRVLGQLRRGEDLHRVRLAALAAELKAGARARQGSTGKRSGLT